MIIADEPFPLPPEAFDVVSNGIEVALSEVLDTCRKLVKEGWIFEVFATEVGVLPEHPKEVTCCGRDVSGKGNGGKT